MGCPLFFLRKMLKKSARRCVATDPARDPSTASLKVAQTENYKLTQRCGDAEQYKFGQQKGFWFYPRASRIRVAPPFPLNPGVQAQLLSRLITARPAPEPVELHPPSASAAPLNARPSFFRAPLPAS